MTPDVDAIGDGHEPLVVDDESLGPLLDVDSQPSFECENAEAVLNGDVDLALREATDAEVEQDGGDDEAELPQELGQGSE